MSSTVRSGHRHLTSVYLNRYYPTAYALNIRQRQRLQLSHRIIRLILDVHRRITLRKYAAVNLHRLRDVRLVSVLHLCDVELLDAP